MRFLFPLAALLVLAASPHAQDALTYQMPAPELAALVDAPRTPSVSLSPDGARMALLARPSVPPVSELAEPELGLAGVRINPRTNGPSRARGFTGVTLRPVRGGTERTVAGFPEGARLRSPSWSPDGASMAILVDREDHVALYVVDVASARARRATDHAVNDAAPGNAYSWLPSSNGLAVRTVLQGRGEAPPAPTVPSGPVVQESTGEAAPARGQSSPDAAARAPGPART